MSPSLQRLRQRSGTHYVIQFSGSHSEAATLDNLTMRVNFIDNLLQDVRYAVRSLVHSPGFTVVAVLSLALGIGANTAVFSLLNTLLLTKLPVRDPDGLYQLIVTHRSATHNAFSYPDYQKLRDGFDIFDGVMGWCALPFEVEIHNSPLEARGLY